MQRILTPLAILFVLALWVPVSSLGPVRAQSGELPDDFFGHWEGTATQVNPTAEWPLEITLTGGRASAVVGRIDYPTLACGGELRLRFLNEDGSIELAEDITEGEAVCADGGFVTLRATADGALEFGWSHPIVNSPATGVLNRAGVEPIGLGLPSLPIDVPVEAREIVAGAPQNPSGPSVVAWYRQTGWIGAPGNAVIYGYPDWVGIGPVDFALLPDLALGDSVAVVGADCLLYAYAVASVEFFETAKAPLGEIFAPVWDDELLTLFSFTEPYNPETEQYERLVVVRAERSADPGSAESGALGTPVPEGCDTVAPAPHSPADAAFEATGDRSEVRGTVTFTFDGGVTSEDEAYVREGVRLAQDFVAETFGLDVSAPVTVAVESADRSGKPPADAWRRTLTIRTAHPVWATSSALQRTKIVVHEYVHLLQEDLLDGQDRGPIWLLEGAAEYIAYLAVAEKGILPYDAVRDYHYAGAAQNPTLGLEAMETPEGFAAADRACCAYSLSPLAVESLVAGRGVEAIVLYYQRLGRGHDPADAFADAFGVAFPDFYATFAAQQQGFAPLAPTHPGLLFPTTFVEGIADVAITSVTTPLERGEQGLLTAVTAPSVACTLALTRPGAAARAPIPAHADPAGNVFWLFTADSDLGKGTVMAEVNCGAAPTLTAIEVR
jgi:hypothetical protein